MSPQLPITVGQRAAWQRTAAAVLVQILDANPDLPLIVWTIGSAGSTLVGRIGVAGPPVQVMAAFHLWRRALTFDEHTEAPGAAGRRLVRATGVRGMVRVTITATVTDDGVDRR